MNIDITQLFTIFDELMPATDEEQGIYWFKTLRLDGLIITFAFSIYEEYVDIIIHNASKVDITSLSQGDKLGGATSIQFGQSSTGIAITGSTQSSSGDWDGFILLLDDNGSRIY